jgi:TP901 family phage tail tape measure protein
LFVVTSAGQRGSEALEILEGAAKAAAIGMGETRDIARLVTSAMNAYGKENLDAARATNVLIGIAREGNFEIEALAGSMGKVLANAAVLGVSFEELGANIASLTRLGVSAEEAVTALDSLMNSTIKTNRKGADALKSLGMTYGSLRKEIREKVFSRHSLPY